MPASRPSQPIGRSVPTCSTSPDARYRMGRRRIRLRLLRYAPRTPRLGDRLRFIPPHCDPTVNLYDRIHVCSGDKVRGDVAGHGSISCRLKLIRVRIAAETHGGKLDPGAKCARCKRRGGNSSRSCAASRISRRRRTSCEAAIAALQSGRTTYPENRGEPALREAVASKLARDNGSRTIPPRRSSITDGATLGIYAALMTLLGPGDEILVPDPIYDAYQSPIRLAGAEPRPREKQRAQNGRFALTTRSARSACTPATRALLLNTPWNPVGTVFTRSGTDRDRRVRLRTQPDSDQRRDLRSNHV